MVLEQILDGLASILNRQPDVFSTVQWGGRAYKLPGPGGDRRRPKLLAYVAPKGDVVLVEFKLPKARASAMVEKYAWLAPHGFRTLAPSGWVAARVSTRRQLGPLGRLLEESRGLYPLAAGEGGARPGQPGRPAKTGGSRAGDPVARRIDQVMKSARDGGWTPPDDDGGF